MAVRASINLKGVVQGVGFRPFVHRLGRKYGLSGRVSNTTDGVRIEAEGKKESISKFYQSLQKDLPALARIINKSIAFLTPIGYKDFVIKESKKTGSLSVLVSPDISICNDCLKELFLPSDRRYLYPFINCTNCGPRFSIIRNLPYDRPFTTMRKFRMCPRCKSEYQDITDRRYHAQPNACRRCGPEVELIKVKITNHKFNLSTTLRIDGERRRTTQITSLVKGTEAIKEAIRLLKAGNIAAIKGVGGFHIACDAVNVSAVKQLRKRKKRPFKPFAIMMQDTKTIRRFCDVSSLEEEILNSPERPIVLLKKKRYSPLTETLSPNNNYLGVMLPYAPLHYLLFSRELSKNKPIEILVMTSANIADEPIEIENSHAISNLKNICDYFLVHNRDIYNRTDDSIVQVMDNKPVILRRSRGYAPLPFLLDKKMKQIFASGAELKGTFCITKNKSAFLSQFIGDLKTYLTFSFYKEALSRHLSLFGIKPRIAVCDLHPDYFSTAFARQLKSGNKRLKLVFLQHHRAHIASVVAEHRIKKNVIGISFDGVGMGTDGRIWGGEFFTGSLKNLKRRARLEYVPMPGGDKATQEPYRMAISYLYAVFGSGIYDLKIDFMNKHKPHLDNIITAARISPMLTSSAGRLFDAVSSILGICDIITYEAQAAIELQMAAERSNTKASYTFLIQKIKDTLVVKPQRLIREIVKDLERKIPRQDMARKFHNCLAQAALNVCLSLRSESGINTVALSGGVFQNKLFLETLVIKLKQSRFKVYYNELVPTNDGAVSLGQAAIANAR